MSDIPNAKEWLTRIVHHSQIKELEDCMLKFAKLHVQAALEAATKSARIIDDPNSYTGNTGSEYPPDQIVDEKSILHAYLLTNII